MVDSASETAVQKALEKSGLEIHLIRLSRSARSVRDAAQVLACDPIAIVKSLVFRGRQTGKAYLAEVSGAHRVDLSLLSTAAGEPLTLAAPDFVLDRTGFPVGAVPPIGHRTRLEAFIDESLIPLSDIWTSAGSEYTMLRLSGTQLMQLTGGQSIRLADGD